VNPLASIFIAGLLVGAIFLFSAREVSRFRKDQRTRSELYPYTRRRLLIRLAVSLLLLLEVFLLFCAPPFFLKLKTADWFLPYITAVLIIALGLVALAWFDFRESKLLASVSQKRLLKELIEDLKTGENRPTVQ
jgi:hypothetical protein